MEGCISDSAVHDKLKFIKRTCYKMRISNLEVMRDILEAYQFTALRYVEDDGSVTLSLNEIDIIENGKDDKEVRLKVGKAILKYLTEYYNEDEMYSNSPNRKEHIPYIFKALIIGCPEKIGEILQCRDGKG